MNLKTHFGPNDQSDEREAPGLFRIPPEASKAQFHIFSLNDDGSTSHVFHTNRKDEASIHCGLLNGDKAPGAVRYVVVNSDPHSKTPLQEFIAPSALATALG